MTDDGQSIRALLAARDTAVAAGDAVGAVAAMAAGAVTYELPPPLRSVHQHDAAVAGLEQWFATWNGPVRSDLIDPEVIVSGDLAVAHGLSHMVGDKQGEGPQDMWFRSTVALQRQDGAWRIIHAHDSVPLQMDGSGAAATDLTPDHGQDRSTVA